MLLLSTYNYLTSQITLLCVFTPCVLLGLIVCENNEEGGKTSYRLKFLLQTKFCNKLVYRLQKVSVVLHQPLSQVV